MASTVIFGYLRVRILEITHTSISLISLSFTCIDINLNSPHKGLGSDSLSDVPEERGAVAVSPVTLPPGLTEEEAEELRLELIKVNI